MKRAAMHLYEEMLGLLDPASLKEDTAQKNWLKAIGIVSDSISRLKTLLLEQAFESQEEEIHFFKEIKPACDAYLIYYLRLLNRQEFIPASASDKIRFYQQELKTLDCFKQVNREFIRYLMTGATYLDEYYFLRSPAPDAGFLEDYGIVYDPALNTRMSQKAAIVRAHQMLSDYYQEQLMDLSGSPASSSEPGAGLTWEAPKVGLAELIYALYATGVFGNAELQRVVRFVTTTFGVRFANPYKVFEEIRLRKKNRTTFLDFLRLNLLRRMDHDDEFSL